MAEKKYKFQLGESVEYVDSYWGKHSGIIWSQGYAGNRLIYGIVRTNGNTTVCDQKHIKKSLGMLEPNEAQHQKLLEICEE